ncbi:MAG: MgtC/SapB family protein [Gemmatimonadaceae bacterium]
MAVAGLIGLLVGIERERSGHGERFAGVRTFLLIGGLGGVAGWFVSVGWALAAVSLVLALGALVTAAYLRTGIDGTTEVAALLVTGLGMLAGTGELAVASGAGAVVVVALSEKATIHGWLERIGDVELRSTLYFAVLALVILPILPDRSYGPWGGINPRSLWIVVLLFSGLSFAGYVARQVVGASRGYGVMGALGGLVSSTVVMLQFARTSRTAPDLAVPLGIGAVAASTVLLPRVLVLSALLNPRVAAALLPLLLPPLLAGVALVGWWLWKSGPAHDTEAPTTHDEHSPLGMGSAIRMALLFQVALTTIAVVRTAFGSSGVIATAALLGLTDMDALTLSMNRLGADASSAQLAATAIGVGILSNAMLKLGAALTLGAPEFRRVAAIGLMVLAVFSAGALVVAR